MSQQAEVGQMIFGNSCGPFGTTPAVDAFVEAILSEVERVFWNVNQRQWDRYEDPKIPGITFRPYYWGDCDCGFEEREAAWSGEHTHGPDCYQTELHARMKEYDQRSGYAEIERAFYGGPVSLLANMTAEEVEPGVTIFATRTDEEYKAKHAVWCAAHDKRRGFEDRLYKKLCAKHGKPARGCAVHCTCGHDERYSAWVAVNGHRDTCSVELPNLAGHGAEIRWYKYPGRGQSCNRDWDANRWAVWLAAMLASVNAADAR